MVRLWQADESIWGFGSTAPQSWSPPTLSGERRNNWAEVSPLLGSFHDFSHCSLTRTWQVGLVCTLCRWENWGMERYHGFPELTHESRMVKVTGQGFRTWKARMPSTITAPLSRLEAAAAASSLSPGQEISCFVARTNTPALELLCSPDSWCSRRWSSMGRMVPPCCSAGPQTDGCCSNVLNDFETLYCSVSNTSCRNYLQVALLPATESQSGQLPTPFRLGIERRETAQGSIWTQSRILSMGFTFIPFPSGFPFLMQDS